MLGVVLVVALTVAALFVAPTLVLAQARPQTAGAVTVWVADPLEKVLRSARPPEACPAAVEIEGARNEWESGQIVVWSTQALSGLRVAAGPLTGPNGYQIGPKSAREVQNWGASEQPSRPQSGAVCCRFVGYVRVEKNSYMTPDEELLAKAPTEFPDPLLEDASINVPAEAAQPIWLTVHIPDDAPAGEYTGTVRVEWEGGRVDVPVRLRVWPFAVPRERHLYFTNWISVGALSRWYRTEAYSDQFWHIFQNYVANAAAHRQNIMWVSPRCIRVYREADGKYSFDFSTFDRWIEICERFGVADRIEISQLGGFATDWGGKEIKLHDWTVTDRGSGKSEQVEAEQVLPSLLPALQDHLRQRGWLERAVLHIADEPSVNNL
ncbi:MAG: hypothetical protein H5T86_14020, partial [Armatimonadetes bacterium]|nr:hypothetical protein [Armatimonadota bacterium]